MKKTLVLWTAALVAALQAGETPDALRDAATEQAAPPQEQRENPPMTGSVRRLRPTEPPGLYQSPIGGQQPPAGVPMPGTSPGSEGQGGASGFDGRVP